MNLVVVRVVALLALLLGPVSAGICSDVVVGRAHYNLEALENKVFEATYSQNNIQYKIEFSVCGNMMEPCENTVGDGDARCRTTQSSASCLSWKSGFLISTVCCGQYNGTLGLQDYKVGKDYGVTITYYGGDMCETCRNELRSTFVNIICDSSTTPLVTAASPDASNPAHYEVFIRHAAGCPTYYESSISPGGVMLILLFVGGTVYLVAGILINKFARGKEGIDMIPNLSFWTAIPGLTKDGVKFTINSIKGLCGGSSGGSYQQMS